MSVKISNQQEFQEIYKKFFNGLTNYAYAVLKDKDIAKDAVQEVFLDLWNKRHDLVIETSLEAYLVRAVKFKSIDYIRKEKTKNEYVAEALAVAKEYEEEPSEDPKMEQHKKNLSYAIAQLPPKCREAFLLSRLNGYTYNEIAEEMNISPKTVENQISRAFKLLRQTLTDLMFFLLFFNFL